MPAVVAAAVAYIAPATAATAFTIGATAVTYASLIGYAAVIGGSIAYSSSQNAKLRQSLANSSLDQGRTVMARDPIAARRLIYGQVLVSGTIVFVHTSGTKNEYLHLVIALAGHECHEIGDIYFGSEVVPLDGSGLPTSGKYVGFARVKKYLGIAAGERDLDLESESGGIWTANHLGKGIARIHVRLKWSADVFASGMPTIKALVKGKKVYDFRTATTGWTANSALCAADYLMDSTFGKGVAQARIRSADVIEAANICDENIVIDGGGTEDRYTTNGTILAAQDPGAILLDLAGAMAGHIVDTGGTWTIRAGAHWTSTVTLTDSDVVGPFVMQPRQSRQDTCNRVRGVYISPQNQWAPADFPAVPNSTYKAKDGGVWLDRDVQFNFTTSPATAQRLAKIDLERSRQQITVTALYTLKAMQLMPGDVVSITRARLGWTAKEFEVVEWSFKPTGADDNPGLGVELTLRETASGVWDWNDGEETTVDLAPNTTLPNPYSVPTPVLTVLSDTTTVIVQPDGTVQPRIKVSWATPNNIHVESGGFVELEYKRTADSTWQVWNAARGDALEDYIAADLKVGTSYDVRARFRNNAGVRGSYDTETGITAVGDSVAPNDVSGLTAEAVPGYIRLKWTPSTSNTVNEYAIEKATAGAGGPWSALADTPNSQFDDSAVTAGDTYWYRVKARSRSELTSAGVVSSGVIALNPAVGAAVPSDPTAPSSTGSGTYDAGDGSVYAYHTISVAALPTNAVWQNLLYRRDGATDWLIGAQLKNNAGTTVRLDDLTPGITYNIAVQAWSAAGGSNIIAGSNIGAPNKSTAPATPSGGVLSAQGVVPKFYPATPVHLFGCAISWAENTEKDFAYYEAKATTTDSDGATDYSWTLYDQGGLGPFQITENRIILYNLTGSAGYVRVRAVNQSGVASAWYRIGNANSAMSIGVGSIAAQNSSDVTVTAIKTGNGSSVRQVRTVFDDSVVVNLAGGSATETFNVSLSNRGFAAAPDVGAVECADPAMDLDAAYDYSNGSNSSTNAVIKVRTWDGSNISGGLRRFSVLLKEYT